MKGNFKTGIIVVKSQRNLCFLYQTPLVARPLFWSSTLTQGSS